MNSSLNTYTGQDPRALTTQYWDPRLGAYMGPPVVEDEGGSLIDFWKVLKILRKWGWLIALIVTIFTSLTALILFRMTPFYLASTTLEIKQEERNIVGVSNVDTVIADREFLTTQIELLKSTSLAENVALSLNLISDTDFYNPDDETWAGLSSEERIRRVTDTFASRLNVSPIGRSRLIEIGFEHSDARQAAKISNTVAETFINNALERKFNATQYAREFLEGRLKSVKVTLETAERDLVKYAAENDIIIFQNDQSNDASGSLDATALVKLDSDLTSALTRRAEAERAYSQSQSSSFAVEILANSAISKLKETRNELNSEYIEKLATFKPEFPEMRELKSRIDLFDREIQNESQSIIDSRREELKLEFELAANKADNLSSRVSALKSSVIDVRGKSIEYNILKRQVDTERAQYEALLQRLKEVSVADNIGSNLVQIVDEAKPPRFPFKPRKGRSLILAFIVSLALGFGLAYMIEMIDDRVRTPEDVKVKLNSTIMGVVPIVSQQKDLVEELYDSQSSISEAYASIRTNLQYSGPNGGPKVIQLTSTRSGEGKSVSSLGVALRFAATGERVLLIDADLRLPTFSSGDHETTGLSGTLTSNVDISGQIHTTMFNNLDLLPSGPPVPNASEILSTHRLQELFDYARDNYDRVIIDSPPILGLADAPILGAKVDATLLIVQTNLLRTPSVVASIERLAVSGTKILGAVLTKYKPPTGGYSDYYKYSYGNDATRYAKDKNSKTKTKSKKKFEII